MRCARAEAQVSLHCNALVNKTRLLNMLERRVLYDAKGSQQKLGESRPSKGLIACTAGFNLYNAYVKLLHDITNNICVLEVEVV